MPRTTPHDSTLSESLQASGGLKQFRTVSHRNKEAADGPFGPPTKKRTRRERDPKVIPANPSVGDAAPVIAPPSAEGLPEVTLQPAPAPAATSVLMENVTLPLSEDLRDRSEEMARWLNRSRSVRKKRLTRNSVIRVALQRFLEDFSLAPGQSINSEEDLLDAARSMRRSQ